MPSDVTPEKSPKPTTEVPKVSTAPSATAKPNSQRLVLAALGIAVIAVALAVWALLRPTGGNAAQSSLSAQDAKTRACSAYNVVKNAVALQTHADIGPEPAAVQAIAANARLAMLGGGQYLLDNLDPAAPSDLADPLRSFATNLQDIAMYALNGITNSEPAQTARLNAAQEAAGKADGQCK
jgi:hypothetical protein